MWFFPAESKIYRKEIDRSSFVKIVAIEEILSSPVLICHRNRCDFLGIIKLCFPWRGKSFFTQINVMLRSYEGNDRFYQQLWDSSDAYSFKRLAVLSFLVLSRETNNRVHEWRWKLDYLVVMGYRRMPLPPSDFLINLHEEWRERE